MTLLSADGTSQTQANFHLRAKALFLEVELPAEAELWSAELDGTPLKPQTEGGSLLIGLPAGSPGQLRKLQLVYAQPVGKLGFAGRVRMPAPKLRYRAARGAATEDLPLADLEWKVRLPAGYDVVQTGGTLTTADVRKPLPAPLGVAGALYFLGGGVDPLHGSLSAKMRIINKLSDSSVSMSTAKKDDKAKTPAAAPGDASEQEATAEERAPRCGTGNALTPV